MQTVYSVRLYHGLGVSPGTIVAYTVPAGYRAILRDIDCYSSAGVSNSEIYIEGDLGQTIFHAEVAATTQDSPQWRGRQVFEPGETISINVGGASAWDITMSGYLLTLP